MQSPTRLEGMETILEQITNLNVKMSPTRLEGMETSIEVFKRTVGKQSPTRLEGMETDDHRLGGRSSSCLRPALRGWKQ